MNAPTRSAGPLLGSGRVTAAEAGACAVERRLAESRTAELRTAGPRVMVSWLASRARRGRRSRHAAGVAARQRADRLQGGLRGGRVRRLRRAGGPRRRDGPDPLGCDQRLPGAGGGVRRARGRHGGGPGPTRPTAPGPARDGRAGRLAMRLLHARFHLLDGGRVLPAGPGRRRTPARQVMGRTGRVAPPLPTASARTGTQAPTRSTARTASICTRSAATCAAAPATGRSGTRPMLWASPRRTTRS